MSEIFSGMNQTDRTLHWNSKNSEEQEGLNVAAMLAL